jgi:hypothetical protein
MDEDELIKLEPSSYPIATPSNALLRGPGGWHEIAKSGGRDYRQQ